MQTQSKQKYKYIQKYTVCVDAEIYDEGAQKWFIISGNEEVEASNTSEARQLALDNSIKHKIPYARNITARTVWDRRLRVRGDSQSFMLFPYNPIPPLYMVRPSEKRKFSFPKAGSMRAVEKWVNAYFTYLRQGGTEDFPSWRKTQQLKEESLRPASHARETPAEQLLRGR